MRIVVVGCSGVKALFAVHEHLQQLVLPNDSKELEIVVEGYLRHAKRVQRPEEESA